MIHGSQLLKNFQPWQEKVSLIFSLNWHFQILFFLFLHLSLAWWLELMQIFSLSHLLILKFVTLLQVSASFYFVILAVGKFCFWSIFPDILNLVYLEYIVQKELLSVSVTPIYSHHLPHHHQSFHKTKWFQYLQVYLMVQLKLVQYFCHNISSNIAPHKFGHLKFESLFIVWFDCWFKFSSSSELMHPS